MCPPFSTVCVRSSLKIFSQIYFFNLHFLRPRRYQERHLGRVFSLVLSWSDCGKPHYIKVLLSYSDSTGVSQGRQSTNKTLYKPQQKRKRDLASVTIKSHITRSLNSFLYLFSKIVLVPRKRLRNLAGGHSTFYLA